ncbi:MAG: tRNA (adenosine(37)-N6)-dimethylallyltransferase MiaA [Verrucomicrobiota bacterium]
MPQDEVPAALQGAFFLAGPTAVGKTDVALAVAEACGGEIVGADAFQVYRGLDLLTAKPSPEALARVPHHLVGTVPLEASFDVARYREAALAAIAGIRARGRLAIVAGGTGLYFRALTRGLADLPSASPELREELNALSLPEALARLEGVDPQAAARVDRRNPRRVIRALEVCLATGQPFSSFRHEWEQAPTFHGVLLERSREELSARIDRRTAGLFAAGVVEEVRAAVEAGGVGPTARQAIGWREITALLRGECTQAEAVAAIAQATRRYAKRQRTWFRREPMFVPVGLSDAPGALAQVLARAAAVPRAGGEEGEPRRRGEAER